MKFTIYSYRDVINGFSSPMLDTNDQSAIRGFSMQVNNTNDMKNFKPQDFSLYKVGTFDVDKGIIEPEAVPIMLVEATDLIFKKE